MASRASASRPHSLADDLRSRSDAALAELLVARPDLARPAASDVVTLAARACTAPSVARALDGLDRGRIRVLESLVVAAGEVAAAARLCAVSQAALRREAEGLRTLALTWKDGAAYRVPHAVENALGQYPGGLAPAEDADHTLDPARIEADLAGLSPGARHLLDSLTWGPPVGEVGASSARLGEAVQEAERLGLVRLTGPGRVLLPRPVALMLRGGLIAPGAPLLEPAPTPRERGGRADDAALAAITELLDQLDSVGHHLGEQSPTMLRSGALGVRELRRLAADLDLDRDLVTFLLELLLAAGLLGTVEADGGRRGSDTTLYAPTLAFDAWRHLPAQSRWAWAALAWLDTDRAPATVTDAEVADLLPRGSAPALLGADASSGALRTARLDTMALLADLAPNGALDLADIVAGVRWRRPRRHPELVRHGTRVACEEGRVLGIVADGALTAPGRGLWSGWTRGIEAADVVSDPVLADEPVTAAALVELGAALPPPAHDILLQGDRTAVVPGRLEGPTSDLMRACADLESRGGAAVFRFTDASVRRWLDTGATADALLARLTERSPAGVPQPIEYLVRDAARRHGRIRVGETSTFLTSDDTASLDTLMHDPQLAALGLRRLAPTVVTSRAERDEVARALRAAGQSPLVEGAAGMVRTRRDAGVRAVDDQRGRRLHRHTQALPSLEDVAHAVQVMRAGDESARSAPTGPGITATDPSVTLGVLREAAVTGAEVWIGLAAADGSTSRLLFRPTVIEAGRATGVVEGSDEPRTFSVHRLIGAVPAGT